MTSNKDLELFTIRPYRSKRLHSYCQRMNKDDDHVQYDDNVADVLKAQGYSCEESPRSIYSVSKLYDALAKYAPSKCKPITHSEHLKAGISLAYACFARSEDRPKLDVLPMVPRTIERITSNPSGSAGLTNMNCTKAESKLRALERGLQTMKGEKKPEPCIAYKRTQFNEKTRLVWGYPYAMTVIEGLVAQPLLDWFKGGGTPMAFAMSTNALGTKLRVAAYHKEWAYSIDMSSFDSSISGELIHVAFNILRTWYDLDQVEPESGITVRELFRIIEEYFIHTPIVMPDSKLYLGKRHGVPSGSFFTQIVDSIVNTIVAGAISHRFSLHVSKREVFVLGDDLLMWSDRKMDLDRIATFVRHDLCIQMHGSEKSERYHYDETVHYLGRDWTKGIPGLSTEEILKRMIYPEKFRLYPKDTEDRERAVRLLILSYASVYWEGWDIAHSVYGYEFWYAQAHRRIEDPAYAKDLEDVNPDYLSGLQRYIRKYLGQRRGYLTTVATQFLL